MTKIITLLASVALLLAACEDHTEGVSSAEVGEAETAPEATETTAEASPRRETLAIDRARSSVGFTGAKVTESHDGSFTELDGSIELDPQDTTASAVRVTIQVGSLQIEPERLRDHLKSADLFDVARFPTATFESTAIRAGGDGTVDNQPATHTITGNLTLHGETRSVTFPAIVEVASGQVSARSEFTIDRKDFGIVYPGMPDDLIHDEVVIRFSVVAPRGG